LGGALQNKNISFEFYQIARAHCFLSNTQCFKVGKNSWNVSQLFYKALNMSQASFSSSDRDTQTEDEQGGWQGQSETVRNR
jgi:hypothetical protein